MYPSEQSPLAYLVTFAPSSAPADLAAEFGVTLRTIQRDLNDRLSFLPVEKADGRYHLHPSALGKLSHQDSWQMPDGDPELTKHRLEFVTAPAGARLYARACSPHAIELSAALTTPVGDGESELRKLQLV